MTDKNTPEIPTLLFSFRDGNLIACSAPPEYASGGNYKTSTGASRGFYREYFDAVPAVSFTVRGEISNETIAGVQALGGWSPGITAAGISDPDMCPPVIECVGLKCTVETHMVLGDPTPILKLTSGGMTISTHLWSAGSLASSLWQYKKEAVDPAQDPAQDPAPTPTHGAMSIRLTQGDVMQMINMLGSGAGAPSTGSAEHRPHGAIRVVGLGSLQEAMQGFPAAMQGFPAAMQGFPAAMQGPIAAMQGPITHPHITAHPAPDPNELAQWLADSLRR